MKKAFVWWVLMFVAAGFAAEPPGPERWEKDIAAMEAKLRTAPPAIGSALFIGSSSIRLWTTTAHDFPRVDIVNHGFGGSFISDSVHYFDRIVKPVRARVGVFYAGGNDLAAGKTPEQVAADFRAFAGKWHAASPVQKLIFNAIKITPSRWALREKIALTNAYIAAFCAEDSRRVFLDLNAAMLTPGGEARPELYREDRLHLNAAGYRIWTELLAPHFDWRSTRFEKDILAFEAADRAQPVAPGGVLFVGASSFKLWTTLEQEFPGVRVVNRGFGGAFLRDCVHYFNRVVAPYQPRLVVLSAGGNDLAFGHHTAEEIAADLRVFRERLHALFPSSKLIVLGLGQSPLRWALREEIDRANQALVADCAKDARCTFVDISRAMLTPAGELRPELYREDRLHLTPAGYAIWKTLLAPLLR